MDTFNDLHSDFSMDAADLTSQSVGSSRVAQTTNKNLRANQQVKVGGSAWMRFLSYLADLSCTLCTDRDDDDNYSANLNAAIEAELDASKRHNTWEFNWCMKLKNGPYSVFDDVTECYIRINSRTIQAEEKQAAVVNKAPVLGSTLYEYDIYADLSTDNNAALTAAEQTYLETSLMDTFNDLHSDFSMDAADLTSQSVGSTLAFQRMSSKSSVVDTSARAQLGGSAWMRFLSYLADLSCTLCTDRDDDDNYSSSLNAAIEAELDASKRHNTWEFNWCMKLKNGPYPVFDDVTECYIRINSRTIQAEEKEAAAKRAPVLGSTLYEYDIYADLSTDNNAALTAAEQTYLETSLMDTFNDLHSDFSMDAADLTSQSVGSTLGFQRMSQKYNVVDTNKAKVGGSAWMRFLSYLADLSCTLCTDRDDDDNYSANLNAAIEAELDASKRHNTWEFNWCMKLKNGPYPVFDDVTECYIRINSRTVQAGLAYVESS